MCLYNLEIDIILGEIAPLRYKDIIQGSDIELLNLLSDTIHRYLVLFLLESNDKKIWTSTEFRYFDEKNGRAIFVLTKNQQETKLRAKTMPAALLHRISLEEDKVDLELLLEYLFQKIRGPPPKGAFNGNV